jgi:flagellar biosynthesis protein FliR
VVGSTIKGLIAGILIGWFAKKFNSLALGIVFGLAVGLLLAFAVAAIPSETGQHYYFEIMLPGAILGLIVGFATQKYGRPSAQTATASQ